MFNIDTHWIDKKTLVTSTLGYFLISFFVFWLYISNSTPAEELPSYVKFENAITSHFYSIEFNDAVTRSDALSDITQAMLSEGNAIVAYAINCDNERCLLELYPNSESERISARNIVRILMNKHV